MVWRGGFESLRPDGGLSHLGGGGETVEMVALGGEAFGEASGVSLLLESVVDDRPACGLSMLETVGGPLEWARRLGVSADSAYKAARLGQIPGGFAIGRLYRVNWTIFIQRGGGAPAVSRGSDVEVAQVPTFPTGRPAASRLPR